MEKGFGSVADENTDDDLPTLTQEQILNAAMISEGKDFELLVDACAFPAFFKAVVRDTEISELEFAEVNFEESQQGGPNSLSIVGKAIGLHAAAKVRMLRKQLSPALTSKPKAK